LPYCETAPTNRVLSSEFLESSGGALQEVSFLYGGYFSTRTEGNALPNRGKGSWDEEQLEISRPNDNTAIHDSTQRRYPDI